MNPEQEQSESNQAAQIEAATILTNTADWITYPSTKRWWLLMRLVSGAFYLVMLPVLILYEIVEHALGRS